MEGFETNPEARARAQARYDAGHTVRFSLKFNIRTDRDIIQWLWCQKSKQGAIKRLIREEIAQKGVSRKG